MSFTPTRSLAGLALIGALAAGCGTAVTAQHATPKASQHHSAPTHAMVTPPPAAPTHAPVTTPPAAPPTHAPVMAPPAPPPAPSHSANPIPQGNGGDHDGDNNGGPSDGDGNI